MATTRSRLTRGLALLAAVAGVVPSLVACTPRLAFASLKNDTSTEVVVLSPWQERLATVPAGESVNFEVGGAGACLPGLLVLAADLRGIATLRGPFCEHDEVTVARAQMVAPGAAVVENATGVEFTEGWLGGVEVGALGVGEQRMVPLAAPAGGCVDVWVQLNASDAEGVVAIAELDGGAKTVVCDSDVVVLEPWNVQESIADEWVPMAPPPRRDPATVTVTNSAESEIQLLVEGAPWGLVYPGEDVVVEFPAPAVRCSTVPLERRGLNGELVPLTDWLCAGDHYEIDDRWPDGSLVVTTS